MAKLSKANQQVLREQVLEDVNYVKIYEGLADEFRVKARKGRAALKKLNIPLREPKRAA